MSQTAALTQADLLGVVRRVTPLGYHAPLEAATGGGWEIHEAQALVLARASTAVQRFEADALILQATGPAYSTGSVTISRASTAAGAVTLQAGSTVEASGSRRVYRLEEDAVFGALDTEKTVRVRAEAPGYGYDCPAGAIDAIFRRSWAGPSDDTLTVTNAAALTGGKPAALDALAWERRIQRGAGEADGSLRERVRTLPDTVFPDALTRLCERYSTRYGVSIEWAPTLDSSGAMDLWLDDECYLDDTTGGVLDDAITERGAVFVLVPDVGQIYDSNNYLDDDLYLDDDGYLDDWDAAKAQVGASVLEAVARVVAGGVAVVVLQVGAPAGAPTIRNNWE